MSELANHNKRDIVFAAYALFVPTAATIFASGVANWPAWARWALLVSWLVAAGFFIYDQADRNQRSDETFDQVAGMTNDTHDRLKRQAEDAREASFEAFLTVDYWFPRKWNWTVYLYDEDTNELSPAWPAPASTEEGKLISFAPGKGATGQAWEGEVTVVRTGSEVHDATHGLSAEQQRHFEERQSVVATPIWSDTRKIGILAGITDDEDRRFDEAEKRSHLERTATILGTLLTTLRTGDFLSH